MDEDSVQLYTQDSVGYICILYFVHYVASLFLQ